MQISTGVFNKCDALIFMKGSKDAHIEEFSNVFLPLSL